MDQAQGCVRRSWALFCPRRMSYFSRRPGSPTSFSGVNPDVVLDQEIHLQQVATLRNYLEDRLDHFMHVFSKVVLAKVQAE